MEVVVKVVVSLFPEFNLLQIDLDADVRNENIFQGDRLLKGVGAAVGDVSESVEELFGPIFEKGLKSSQ